MLSPTVTEIRRGSAHCAAGVATARLALVPAPMADHPVSPAEAAQAAARASLVKHPGVRARPVLELVA